GMAAGRRADSTFALSTPRAPPPPPQLKAGPPPSSGSGDGNIHASPRLPAASSRPCTPTLAKIELFARHARRMSVDLLVELRESKLRCAVNRDKQVKFAFFSALAISMWK